MNRKKYGQVGEKLAGQWLLLNEFRIVEYNYRTKYGEIDIIAFKKGFIHFIEVKSRANYNLNILARDSIGKNKLIHIKKTAQYYIYQNKITDYPIQFDAIEVYLNSNELHIIYIPEIIEE